MHSHKLVAQKLDILVKTDNSILKEQERDYVCMIVRVYVCTGFCVG